MIPSVFLPFLAYNYESYLCEIDVHTTTTFWSSKKLLNSNLVSKTYINCSRMNNSIIWYPLLYRTTPIFSKSRDWKLGHMSYLPVVAPFKIVSCARFRKRILISDLVKSSVYQIVTRPITNIYWDLNYSSLQASQSQSTYLTVRWYDYLKVPRAGKCQWLLVLVS